MSSTVVDLSPTWDSLPVAAPAGEAMPTRHPLWTKQFQNMTFEQQFLSALQCGVEPVNQGDASLWTVVPEVWRQHYIHNRTIGYDKFTDVGFNELFEFTIKKRIPLTTHLDRLLYPYCPRIEYNADNDKVECKMFVTPRDGAEGRYTATTMARAIKIIMPSLSVSDKEIGAWTVGAEYGFRPVKLNLAVTRSEIKAVYQGGPNSCMSGSGKTKECIHPDTGHHIRFHPCEAYAYPLDRKSIDEPESNGVAFAYFGPIENPTGRCVVRYDGNRKYYGRVYGDDRLRQDLEKLGFVHRNNICDGIKLSRLKVDGYRNRYLVPFVDGSSGYNLTDNAIFVTSMAYQHSNSSSGVVDFVPRCTECNSREALVHYADLEMANGEALMCDMCASNRHDLVPAQIDDNHWGWVDDEDAIPYSNRRVALEYGKTELGLVYCEICQKWHEASPRPYRLACSCGSCGGRMTVEWYKSRPVTAPARVCQTCFEREWVQAIGLRGGEQVTTYIVRDTGYLMPDGTLFATMSAANASGWWRSGAEWGRGAQIALVFDLPGEEGHDDDSEEDQDDEEQSDEEQEEGEGEHDEDDGDGELGF